MCEFHDYNYNGFGDMWWTDKCIYFSRIDGDKCVQRLLMRYFLSDKINVSIFSFGHSNKDIYALL